MPHDGAYGTPVRERWEPGGPAPRDFRFPGKVVYIRRDSGNGDVILSERPAGTWEEFIQLRERLGPVPDDFLADREQRGYGRGDPFEGWPDGEQESRCFSLTPIR